MLSHFTLVHVAYDVVSPVSVHRTENPLASAEVEPSVEKPSAHSYSTTSSYFMSVEILFPSPSSPSLYATNFMVECCTSADIPQLTRAHKISPSFRVNVE